jgi:hypothetical protein
MATAQTQVIIDFITSLGWDTRPELGYPIVPGPYIPPDPDRLLIITGAGGPGYTTEEPATDAGTFQARLRSVPDDVLVAEAAAGALDQLILRARFPVVIDGVPIVMIYRAGSGPTPLPLDPSDRRFELTCNYTAVMGV